MRLKRSHQVGIQIFAPGDIAARDLDVVLTLEGEETKIRSREFETQQVETKNRVR